MKALVGSWADRPHRLLAENAVLRARVAELLAELRRANEELEVLRSEMVPSHVGDSVRVVDDVAVEEMVDDVAVEVALTSR